MNIASFIGVLGVLGFVLALLVITLKLLKRYAPFASGANQRVTLEIVQRLPLGPRQSIAVVTILRLGSMPKDIAVVLKALKNGQRASGGFGKEDDENAADLESTYRVMRCFMMLKAQPDRVEGLRTFVAKCRNEDGGYGVAPGEPSSVSGTYYAATIRHWLGE